jgi:16S rRNA U516 pseudouridylate synthase RsuA-like enzyme
MRRTQIFFLSSFLFSPSSLLFDKNNSGNKHFNRTISSQFPSISSHFSDLKHQDDNNSTPLRIRTSSSENKRNHNKPVDVAFEEEEGEQQSVVGGESKKKPKFMNDANDPYDDRAFNDSTRADSENEDNISPFGDMLHERMRELKAEKHRDFKITTHISSRLSPTNNNNNNNNQKIASTEEETDDNFFSFFDDVESELQSGASSSALHQLAFATSNQQQQQQLLQDGQGTTTGAGILLIRAIARAGVCSRRAAINLVASGKVKIDGVVQRDPFAKVEAHNDIHVEGHRGRLRFCAPRLWAFHKPSFFTVTNNSVDDRRQNTIWNKYSQLLGVDHLIPVGSLPTRCHGLLMLTNDGELAKWLEHKSTRVQSTWIFRVRPPIDPSLALKLNTKGVNIGGVIRKEFHFINFTGGRSRSAIRIKVQAPEESSSSSPSNNNNVDDDEDNNQQHNNNNHSLVPVTQMLEAINRRVVRGGRVGYGPFTLSGLPPGGLREVTVPPYYMKYVNPAWVPFIERDWPYFRRDRVQKLIRMSRWRNLNDKEQEEIESFSCDELRRAFEHHTSTSAEIELEAKQFAEALVTEPAVEVPFVHNNNSNNNNNNNEEEEEGFDLNNSKHITWKF